jgi:hypothetical protein
VAQQKIKIGESTGHKYAGLVDPKLCAKAILSGDEFATRLYRAIAGSGGTPKLIEAQPSNNSELEQSIASESERTT